MIKNKIIFIFSVGLILSPLTSLVAVEKVNTTTTQAATSPEPKTDKKVEAIKEKLKKDIDDRFNKNVKERIIKIADEISKDTTSKKIKLSEKSQNNLKSILNKIYNKFNNQINSLSIIDNKMSLKINDLEKEGKEVKAIRDQYDTAKTALINARIEVLAANNFAFEQTSKETAKETMRILVKKSEDSIRTAGEEYKKLIPLFAKLEGNNAIKINN